jgi:hypothetical protein
MSPYVYQTVFSLIEAGLSLDEMQTSMLAFGPPPSGSKHDRICVEARYNCSKTSKFDCRRPISAADIQQRVASHWVEKFKKKFPLELIGNLSKTARSSPVVGQGQAAQHLRIPRSWLYTE